jgi:hypothetical protein
MAVYYVRSTDGNDSDNGSTWTLAKASIVGALTAAAAGDTIYVSQAHNRTTASSYTYPAKGTATLPVSVICVNDSAMPPTALAETAIESMTVTAAGNIIGFPSALSFINWYGINFRSSREIQFFPTNPQFFTKCSFQLLNATTPCVWDFNPVTYQASTNLQYHECTFSAAHTGSYMQFFNSYDYGAFSDVWTCSCSILFKGCVFTGTAPAVLFKWTSINWTSFITLDGCDLSLLGAASYLCANSDNVSQGSKIYLRNCKLNANLGGVLQNAMTNPGTPDITVENCDSGNSNVRSEWYRYQGYVETNTAVVRMGGASNGTSSFSWLATANSFVSIVTPLELPAIVTWFNATGLQRNATISFMHEGTSDLGSTDIWAEIEYQGDANSPKTSFISSRPATYPLSINATTYPDDSSSNWVPGNLVNTNCQKFQLQFTTQIQGFVVIRIYLAKPNYAVYVDPLVRFS